MAWNTEIIGRIFTVSRVNQLTWDDSGRIKVTIDDGTVVYISVQY